LGPKNGFFLKIKYSLCDYAHKLWQQNMARYAKVTESISISCFYTGHSSKNGIVLSCKNKDFVAIKEI